MSVYDGLHIVLFVIGLYMLLSGIRMRHTLKVPSALLAAEEQGKVKDEKALAYALSGPMLLLALIMLFDGIAGEIFYRVYVIEWFRYIQTLAFLGGWMYFMKKYQDAKALFVEV